MLRTAAAAQVCAILVAIYYSERCTNVIIIMLIDHIIMVQNY